MTTERTEHWDTVYRTRAADDVSWFQADPVRSLELITGVAPRHRSVIDVGAGASTLVDALATSGIDDVTALDISAEALEQVAARTAALDPPVARLVADVTSWVPRRRWDAWHDRAVFHFLTDPADRAAYVAAATEAIEPGGVAVIATFATDGPEQCSGLPTARYDADGLAEAFGPAFALEHAEREVHRTPSGAEQPFTWVVLRRR